MSHNLFCLSAMENSPVEPFFRAYFGKTYSFIVLAYLCLVVANVDYFKSKYRTKLTNSVIKNNDDFSINVEFPIDVETSIQNAPQVQFNHETPFIPAIYIVTPTYQRETQISDLVSVIQAMAVSWLNIQLIIIEDTENHTPCDTLKLLQNTYSYPKSKVNITLLVQNSDKNKRTLRGIFQRNAGLDWIANNQKNTSAVIYLADDDNTYSHQLFHEFVNLGGTVGDLAFKVGRITKKCKSCFSESGFR